MDFSKTTIGNNIGELLRENLTEDRDKESIRRIMVGNKLAYGEANHLIRSLLYALIVADGEHVEEVKLDKMPQTGSQDQNNQEANRDSLTESQSDPTQILGAGTQDGGEERRGEKFNLKNVCRYYKNGNCKFKKDCRREHPPFCQ